MSKKIILPLIIVSALALFSFHALAQEDVTASDLEVSDSGIFSWIQDIVRDIQILVTFDPIKKSERQIKKASRQLIRIREMANADPDDPRLQKRVEKFDAKYESLIDKINTSVEGVKADDPDLPELKSFLDKYTDHQLKHQEILTKLEEQVPEDVMDKIRANREGHLEKFGEVMNRLQEKEEFKEQLKAGLEDMQEAIQNRVKRMEIVEELGEKSGPAVKAMVNEIKQENRELFRTLKAQKQELIRSRQQTQAVCEDQTDCENPTDDEEVSGYPGYIIKGIQARDALQQTVRGWGKT